MGFSCCYPRRTLPACIQSQNVSWIPYFWTVLGLFHGTETSMGRRVGPCRRSPYKRHDVRRAGSLPDVAAQPRTIGTARGQGTDSPACLSSAADGADGRVCCCVVVAPLLLLPLLGWAPLLRLPLSLLLLPLKTLVLDLLLSLKTLVLDLLLSLLLLLRCSSCCYL
ncbi:uncharacterized protein LOC115632465 isoform X1 [Scaptodrosophila lebanonensis]|uniref:Uncharacterized protein LOC115632465 isoform X1 n=1 Tax=Drosophila lebanonensis TaxID=7225 RepID=A0A6J2UBP9_DROLE|nr:uncharacterized protein LOC115632465 isoform X1 [Scaptodrosophila lebanonensis]